MNRSTVPPTNGAAARRTNKPHCFHEPAASIDPSRLESGHRIASLTVLAPVNARADGPATHSRVKARHRKHVNYVAPTENTAPVSQPGAGKGSTHDSVFRSYYEQNAVNPG